MAGQVTVVSDVASPLRPQKVSSPFIARRSLVFEKAPNFSSQDSDLFSHGDSSILSNYRTAPSSRRGSFTFSNAALNNYNNNTISSNNNNNNNNNNANASFNNTKSIRNSFSMADLPNLVNKNRPFEVGNVRKLVTSFSNPAFHLNINQNGHQSGLKPVRSSSVIIGCPSVELTASHLHLDVLKSAIVVVDPPALSVPQQQQQKEEVVEEEEGVAEEEEGVAEEEEGVAEEEEGVAEEEDEVVEEEDEAVEEGDEAVEEGDEAVEEGNDVVEDEGDVVEEDIAEETEGVKVTVEVPKVMVEVPRIAIGSISSLTHPPIGPIARMNCREQTVTDEDGSLCQSNQLLAVPFKERFRSHIKNSSDGAPCLELNPFSPYSPGILNLESIVAFNHQTENHKSVDLNEFIETVDFGGEGGTFDYIGQALGSSQMPVEETLTMEQILSNATEKIDEKEEPIAEEKKEALMQPDTYEGHALVVHLEEALATVVPVEPTVESYAAEETIIDDAPEVQHQPAQETVSECPQEYEAAPVDSASLVALPNAVSEAHPVSTSTSTDTFECKNVSPASQSRQSSSQLNQRHDGSMVMHDFPHEPLRGSQLLEKRQQRHSNYSKLNGSSLLHLTTSRCSNHSGPSLMLASSSTSGSTASSSTRLQTPQTCSGSFERNTVMSEDDISMPSASVQSSDHDHDRSSIQYSFVDTYAAAGGAATSSSVAPPSTTSGSKKPAKIVTRPTKGLSMALGRTFSMILDITSAATTVGFEDESLEHVVSSKVSRTGKLFAQKIKTIANFEYNTSRKLGKGNFGVVYQGKSTHGDEEVAIKKITRKLPGEIEKLGLVQREMKVCRLFRNKTGIVPLLDIITTNKHHYLVFEKAEGDLAEMIKARCKDVTGIDRINRDPYQQPMSPSCTLGAIFNIHEIRSIMRTVVLGTQSLHYEGFSHKDIKPANILFREGQGLLCDFGLCSQREELPDNQFFGTQDYASPEARRVGGSKKCDYIQGDVYSLGAVLYELATGSVLSKVISQGINWQKLALFGGRSFSELIQGMVDDLEKRWTIDRVVSSRFWDEPQSDSASAMTAVSESLPFSPFSAITAAKLMRQGVVGGSGGVDVVAVGAMGAVDSSTP